MENDLSGEVYVKIVKNLEETLKSWAGLGELNTQLAAKQYPTACKIYITLSKLQVSLAKHIKVDVRDVLEAFLYHLHELSQGAIAEIHCPIEDQRFLKWKRSKIFYRFYALFQQSDLDADQLKNLALDQKRNLLKAAAVEQWDKIIRIETNFAKIDPTEVNVAMANLTKMIIKQFAIATELSLPTDFRKLIHNETNRHLSRDLLFKLNTEVVKYKSFSGKMGIAARAIIQTFPEFKRINISEYIRKAGGVSFLHALEKLQTNPILSMESKSSLENIFQKFMEKYESCIAEIVEHKFIADDHRKICLRLAGVLSPYSKTLYRNWDQAAELLAHICAIWTHILAKGILQIEKASLMQPQATQLLTVFWLLSLDDAKGLENHLAQVQTGEGKSISLGIIFCVFCTARLRCVCNLL